ncbi:hypothetical protein M378DRAFT_482432 [Amanita muscaria Koide BX008]|uniref:Uncharacterized protein n=1 Tax=Amanita muscaria (strain Koide BX008) TaxID=946122 RepID=A0A0C2XME0_AMAMK|nr:hypothetical protein M378DRAFT_482432 [Amanita muscaria Koide BX008]
MVKESQLMYTSGPDQKESPPCVPVIYGEWTRLSEGGEKVELFVVPRMQSDLCYTLSHAEQILNHYVTSQETVVVGPRKNYAKIALYDECED